MGKDRGQMPFTLAGAHREFFEKNGFIEFEAVLSQQDIETLAHLTDQVLEKRLTHQLSFHSAPEMFRVGRDLWRDHPLMAKMILSRRLAQLAADLFKQPILHLAYDQALRTTSTPGYPALVPSHLQSTSSIQPLVGGVLFHLKGARAPLDLIPKASENGVFLSPQLLIPWEIFFQTPHQSYLLITYAAPESIYILEKKDLHGHGLKKIGYSFGDRLQSKHHPIVYK